jgi:hypothetical protein
MEKANVSRRRFFSTATVLVGAVCAGCIGVQSQSNNGGGNTEMPEIIDSVEFDSGENIDVSRESSNPPETPPEIEYNSRNNTLSIIGEILYSSKTCDELYLNDTTYNGGEDRLVIKIAYREKPDLTDTYCSDAADKVPYNLEVTLATDSVEEVKVIETHYFPNRDQPDIVTIEEI